MVFYYSVYGIPFLLQKWNDAIITIIKKYVYKIYKIVPRNAMNIKTI